MRSLRLFMWCVTPVMVALSLVTSLAVAQSVSPGLHLTPESYLPAVFLLQARQVQDELGLSDQQLQALQGINAEFSAERHVAPNMEELRIDDVALTRFPELKHVKDEGSRLLEYRRLHLNAYFSCRVEDEVCSPAQRDRLRQLQRRLMGMLYLLSERGNEELHLTPVQRDAITEVHRELLQKGAVLVRTYRDRKRNDDDKKQRSLLGRELNLAIARLEAGGIDRVAAEFSDEQKRLFRDLFGSPLSFSKDELVMLIPSTGPSVSSTPKGERPK